MAKVQTQMRDDELEMEDKILNPDVTTEEEGAENQEEEDDGFSKDEIDPFNDKWEE